MANPSAGSALTPIPRSTPGLDIWYDAKTEIPSTLILVRAWNGHYVQKCFYDAGDKKWMNQKGEEIQVLKWKFDK